VTLRARGAAACLQESNSSIYELNPLPGAYGGWKSDIPGVCGGCGLKPLLASDLYQIEQEFGSLHFENEVKKKQVDILYRAGVQAVLPKPHF
jgi:hypothetical protein